jgi:hypothetical protein
MKEKIFLNLTNGIEIFDKFPNLLSLENVSFIRIQSTHCEQKNYEEMFSNLDSNFLMHLAMGFDCIVYDFGSRRFDGNSRACWQGLELIRFICNKIWFDLEFLENDDVKKQQEHFIEVYKYCRPLKRKLKYFKKFSTIDPSLKETGVRLKWFSYKTEHDNDIEFHKNILKKII